MIASLALIGWAGNIAALRSVLAEWPSMKFNTAGCVLLITFAMTQVKNPVGKRRTLAEAAAMAAALIAGATLCQHLTGFNFGIDDIFFADPWAMRMPGRMSAFTALCLFFFAAACHLALRGLHYPVSQFLAILPLSGASAILVGYLLSGEAPGRVTVLGTMAFPTALSVAALGLSFLGMTVDQGIMRVFSMRLSGSLMLRRLFPIFSATTLMATWIVYKAISLNILSRPLAGSILVVTTLLILFFSMARYAHRNNQGDAVKSRLLTDLEDYRSRMTAMLEAMPQIVWSTDSAGKMDFFNSRWPEYVGATWADRDWTAMVHPEERPACQAQWFRSLESGRPFAATCRLEDRNGKYRWHLIRFLPITSGSAPSLKWLGTGTDIEEQRRAEEEKMLAMMREQAERERSEFTSNFLVEVSHEVRTPLSGVLGMADALASTRLDSDQKDFLDSLKASGKALLELVNQVLDLHQIESGRMKLADSPFGLRQLIEEVAGENALMAAEKGLRLRFADIPRKEMHFSGDRLRIRQVLTNLVANAIKFTDQGCVSVSVAVRALPNGRKNLDFRVSDTGPGVIEQPKTTTPNSSGDSFSRREQRGFGLGLSICRKILRLMDSEMQVESHPGRGSSFSFRLELPAAEPSPPAHAGALPETYEITAPKNVLLVEDQPTNQKVLRFYLGKMGCSVEIAGDGEQALLMAKAGNYDLVLMDCYMPKMDGYEATKSLRSLGGRWAEIPIIALTANAVPGIREACLRAGMNDYLTKPVSQASLAKAINLHTSRPAASPPGERADPNQRLDLKILAEIRALPSGEELISELLKSFAEGAGSRMAAIGEALRNGDAQKVRRECHALRSSAVYLGALEVQRICREIELTGDGEIATIAFGLLEKLGHACSLAPKLVMESAKSPTGIRY